jgi:branched-chain amino acid transport system substrate-binding protein
MRDKSLLVVLCLVFLLVPFVAFGADEIKIGFHSPLTGWAASDGLDTFRGAELAVKSINAGGGINGKKIKLINYDDRCESKEALIVANKLIESDKVVAIVSGSYSGPNRAVAPIFNQNKIPYISCIGTHPEIPIGRPYVVQVAVMSEIEGRVGAKVAVDKLKAKTASLLVMDNDFGMAVTDGFRKLAPKFGIKILNEYKYPLGEKDFRALLGNVKRDNPDVLWASGYYEEAAQISKQAKELGVKAQIIGQEGFDSPKLIELGGDATEGVLFVTNCDSASQRPVNKKFKADFEKEYKSGADANAAMSFDGMNILAEALKKVGTNPEKIVAYISQLKNYDAVSGPFMYFDQERRVVRPIPVMIVKSKAFATYYTSTDKDLIAP